MGSSRSQLLIFSRFLLAIGGLLSAAGALAGEAAPGPAGPGDPQLIIQQRGEVYIGGDEEVHQALQRAAALLAQKKWADAAVAYQSIIDRQLEENISAFAPVHADRLHGELYVSAAEECRRRLAEFPPEGVRAYVAQYDDAARTALGRALATGNTRALKDVAARYALTESGEDALDALGNVHFERGRFESAEQNWSKLLRRRKSAAAAVKLAYCRALLGEPASARRALLDLPPETEMTIAGRAHKIAHVLEGLPDAAARPRSDDWPSIAGNAAGAAAPAGAFDLGRELWCYEAATAAVPPSAIGEYARKGVPLPRIHYPVVAGGRVYVNTGLEIICLDLTTGAVVWKYSRRQQRTATRDLIGGGVVEGGRFYAVVAGSLVALDAATGEAVWEATGEIEPIFGEAGLISQPMAAGGRVFVGVTKVKPEGESFLMALDAADGSLVARVFLESHSQPRYLGLGALGSPPVMLGDAVVYCTNLGTVASADADSLEVNWLWRYPFAPSALKAHGISASRRWAANPPAIIGDTVVVAPQDSHWLYALNLHDGSVRWRQPRRDARYFVAPAGSGRVFTFGRGVSAVDLATGKLLWTSKRLEGEPTGRPAVGVREMLVPTRRDLYRLDAATGEIFAKSAWGDPLQPGNLCVAGGRLIAGTLGGAAAFESWEESQRVLEGKGPWCAMGLGRLYLNRGRPEEALAFFEKSKELDGDDLPNIQHAMQAAYEALAKGALAKDPEAALDYCRLALRSAPAGSDKVRLLMRTAELLDGLDRHAEAVECYQSVLADHPDQLCRVAGSLKVRAAILAQKKIEELIARHGPEIFAEQERKASELLARAAGFAVELDKVVTVYPNSEAAAGAAEALAQSRLEAGSPDEAAGYMQNVADILPRRRRPGILLRAAEMLDAADRHDLAAVFLRQLARDHPNAEETARHEPPTDLDGLQAGADELFALPLRLRWRSAARLSSAKPVIFPGDSDHFVQTPFGRRRTFFVAHSDAPRWALMGQWGRRRRYDYIECRTVREGYLVWARGLAGWDGKLRSTKTRLLIAGHGTLQALDAATGADAWRYQTEGGGQNFKGIMAAATEPERVYLCTSLGKVVCMKEKDGAVVWQQQMGEVFVFRDSLTVLDDCVGVFSENPAGMCVFDKRTGEVRRSVKFDLPHTRITDPPICLKKKGVFAVPVADMMVLAVDAKTTEELWRHKTGFAIGRLLAEPSEERVVVIPDNFSRAGKLQVLETGTGKTLWERGVDRDTVFDTAINSRAVFVLARSGREQCLRGFSMDSGEALFDDYKIPIADLQTVEAYGDHVVLTGEQARPRVLVLNRGRKAALTLRPPGADSLSALVVGGALMVATDRGTFCYSRAHVAPAEHAAARAAEPESTADFLGAAQRAFEIGSLPDAIRLLCAAMERTDNDVDYLRMYDRMSGIRDALHEKEHPAVRCVKMDRPPEIDGIMADDWDESACLKLDTPEYIEMMLPGPGPGRNLAAASGRPRGANDISMKVYAGWDHENFYLAVDVTDRTHRTTGKKDEKWIGDQLIIAIDCHNDGGYGYGWGDYILSQGLMDKPKDDKANEEKPEGEYSVKLKEDHSGVVYESSIPWSYLREIKPEVGACFGFGVTVTDDDGGGVMKSTSWTPGLYLHKDTSKMGRGFSPELLGDMVLTLPRGYGDPQPRTQEDEEDKKEQQ